jgi:hypothetical protein
MAAAHSKPMAPALLRIAPVLRNKHPRCVLGAWFGDLVRMHMSTSA